MTATGELTDPGSKDMKQYYFKIFHDSLNLIAHLFIGAVVGICTIFTFINGLPLGVIRMHVILCVLGWQLIMSEAILSLSPHNGWTASLGLGDKKRTHTVLSVIGSALSLAGSGIIIKAKAVNWDTLHGITGLVSVIFTAICFVNGITSLYAFEWRRFIPPNLSKISHIVCGILGYAFSCISLVYAYEKAAFINWMTVPLKNFTIAITVIFSFIVLINPMLNTFYKTKQALRK